MKKKTIGDLIMTIAAASLAICVISPKGSAVEGVSAIVFIVAALLFIAALIHDMNTTF